MKASHRRILRWVLGVLAAVVLVGAFLVANVVAQVSGGWDEVFDRSHPQDGDPEVVAARAAGAQAVEAEIDRVVGVAASALAAGRVAQPAPTGAAAVDDRPSAPGARRGSTTGRSDDAYDLAASRCGARSAAAEGVPGRHGLPRSALLEAGWTRAGDGGLPG